MVDGGMGARIGKGEMGGGGGGGNMSRTAGLLSVGPE